MKFFILAILTLLLKCSYSRQKISNEKVFLISLLDLKAKTDFIECSPILFINEKTYFDQESDAKLASGSYYSNTNQTYRDIVNGSISIDGRMITLNLGLKELPRNLLTINGVTHLDKPLSEWSFVIKESRGDLYKIGLFRNVPSNSKQWSYLEDRVKILKNGIEIMECDFPNLRENNLAFRCEMILFANWNSESNFNWNAYTYHQENNQEILDCL